MAKVSVSTTRIVVKGKVKNDLCLCKGLIKLIIIILAVAGVNRGVYFKNSFYKWIYVIYSSAWPFLFCCSFIYYLLLTPVFEYISHSIRALLYNVCYFSTIFLTMTSFNKLIYIYNKMNKLNYVVQRNRNLKNVRAAVLVVSIALFNEIFSLALIIYKSHIKSITFGSLLIWYMFFVLHLECTWRYVVLNSIRANLESVYGTMKYLQRSVDNSKWLAVSKTSTNMYAYKLGSNKSFIENLLAIRNHYEDIVDVQRAVVSLLNPVFIINFICSIGRAFCDIFSSIWNLKFNDSLTFALEEIFVELATQLRTTILVLIICYEFNFMLQLDKKMKIKLTEMLVYREDTTEKQAISQFIHFIEVNGRKFVMARVMPLDLTLPWLCFVNILQFSVLVMQFLKVVS